MVRVYVIIHRDRHTDTDVEVWHDRDLAIKRCRERVEEAARFPEDIDDSWKPDCWEYYVKYSEEGDCAWVVAREIRG